MSEKGDRDKNQNEPKDEDINVEEIMKIIAPEDIGASKREKEIAKSSAAKTPEKKEVVKPAKVEISEKKVAPAPQMAKIPEKKEPTRIESLNPPQTGNAAMGKEEQALDRFATKVDEVNSQFDQLSKSMAQLNQDLQTRIKSVSDEMDRLVSNLKDASLVIEQARDSVQAHLPSPQSAAGPGREPSYGAPPRQQQPSQQGYQQPPPQQGYPPPPYGYQQQPPQQYSAGPPAQQGYYQSPSQQQGFFQQPPPPPPAPSVSPEDAVTRGTESLKGTIFDDVVSSLGQVASIVFSRLLDAREKILRIDPSFPVQEMDPTLSELRANPRMKLSQVDKRKIIERMLYWASRLPRPP